MGNGDWGPTPDHAPPGWLASAHLSEPQFPSTHLTVLQKLYQQSISQHLLAQQLESCWMHVALPVNIPPIKKGLGQKLSKGHTIGRLTHSSPQWTLGKVSPQRGGSRTLRSESCASMSKMRSVSHVSPGLCKLRAAFRRLASCQHRPTGRQNLDTLVSQVICSFQLLPSNHSNKED